MLSDDVLDEMMVVGRQTLSRRVKISSLDSISSGTASITRSASRAACSTDDAYSRRLNARSASSGVTLPSSTALSRLVRISVSALRNVVGRMSSRMVRYPPSAAAWAMPRPMIPAPITAMVRTSAIRLDSLLQLGEDRNEIRVGLAHVLGKTLLFVLGEEINAHADAAKRRCNVVHEIHIADEFTTGWHRIPFECIKED